MEYDRRESELVSEARRVGHPDPANASWGEVNVLSVASFRNGGDPLPADVAEHILHVAEFDADFNASR